jgi:hypothetical protein
LVGCCSFSVKGFCALWDNIYECVFTAIDFPVILDGKFMSGIHNVIVLVALS